MEQNKKDELISIAHNLMKTVEDIKEMTKPETSKDKDNIYEDKIYPMCTSQFAQIDCRVTTCKYYQGGGVCSNLSPAIVLNESGSFWCKSKVDKNE